MEPRCNSINLILTLLIFFVQKILFCNCYGLRASIGYECGEVKHRASGMISSPNLPTSYSRAVFCKWKIIAPEQYNQLYMYVWLKPGKKLSYELKHCLSDHLAINQIIDGKKEKREKYCGKHGFFRTRTFGREAEIRFWTSPMGTNTAEGRTSFRLLWFASKGCSTEVNGHKGILQSPNYPNMYPSDTFCTWKVTTPSREGNIKIRFIKFDLQGRPPHCKKDYLLVKDGNKTTIGRFCGRSIPKKLLIKGNSVTFVFKSNKKKNFPGFSISWSTEYKRMNDDVCGITHFPPNIYRSRERRYIGGHIPHRGTMPWMVQIIASEYHGNKVSEMSCGGALIDGRWVLTAAHCVIPIHQRSYRVYIGGLGNRDQHAVIDNVKKVHIHPAYMGSMTNDIALLELTKDQPTSYWIRTLCLPNSETVKQLNEHSQCWMGGWGRTSEFNAASDQLKVSILKYKGHCTFRPDIICAQSPNIERRIGPCTGDSGGPLACETANGRYVLAGVLSHGPQICGSQHDYYANTAYYTDWIESTIKEKK